MLKEIREREKKASKGPWKSDVRNGCMAVYNGPHKNCLAGIERFCIHYKHGIYKEDGVWFVEQQDCNDNDFIAHARTDIPKLLELIDRAREIIGYYYAETESEEAWRFLKDTEE